MVDDNTPTRPPVILVADDEPVNRSLIERRLERDGYVVLTAQNGRRAVDVALASTPDLIILDVMMPEMDGLEACRLIKENEGTRDIPIIFLSARDETEVKVSGLNLGANDYISKPFKAEELLARVEVALRLKQERDQLRQSAAEAKATAEIAQERALTDALTGLLNRYGLQRTLAHEQAEVRRYGRALSCLMIDLDDFKAINDLHGHAAGDLALQQITTVLTETVRGADMIFRYGGDEFLVLLPETNIEGAQALAEKIREGAATRTFRSDAGEFRITLSIGAATLGDDESGNDMIAHADMALYRAKEGGRNRVEAAR